MSSLFGKKSRGEKRYSTNNDFQESILHSVNKLLPYPTSQQENDNDESLPTSLISKFSDMALSPSILQACTALGFHKPTPVQRSVIPFLLKNRTDHVVALASTGTGKTAAFVLPILHHLSLDPYGIYAVILSPTRELAKQIHEQVMALGSSSVCVRSSLVIGGMDMTHQACELTHKKPHFCIATPGRLAAILRGPNPPPLKNVRYVVLDEADRILMAKSGFERDIAEILLHTTTTASTSRNIGMGLQGGGIEASSRTRRTNFQTLLFSATLTRSLESLEQLAGGGMGRIHLKKFIIQEDKVKSIEQRQNKKRTHDNLGGVMKQQEPSDCPEKKDGEDEQDSIHELDTTNIPSLPVGLRQEYIFMPSHVRDGYLITAIRHLMMNGGRLGDEDTDRKDSSGWNHVGLKQHANDEDEDKTNKKWSKARSAIIFVSTCERTALVSGILSELGVGNVALHSLLSQNRRLAALAKFKSQHVRVLVATDVASRGLDIPTVDLVINAELPRRPVDYIHRVGRTARQGRRGRAVSLVGESDVALVHAVEKISGRALEKCTDITDDMALKLLGSVTKAIRLSKMKLADIGFDELVKKMKGRKVRDRKDRLKAERAARRLASKTQC